jgi:hypothetical protein
MECSTESLPHAVFLSTFYMYSLFSPCNEYPILFMFKNIIFHLLTNFTISKPTWVQSVTTHELTTFNYPLWWTLAYLEAIFLSCCSGDAHIGALRDNILRHLTQLAPWKLSMSFQWKVRKILRIRKYLYFCEIRGSHSSVDKYIP